MGEQTKKNEYRIGQQNFTLNIKSRWGGWWNNVDDEKMLNEFWTECKDETNSNVVGKTK